MKAAMLSNQHEGLQQLQIHIVDRRNFHCADHALRHNMKIS
jgi:hypothetical protein